MNPIEDMKRTLANFIRQGFHAGRIVMSRPALAYFEEYARIDRETKRLQRRMPAVRRDLLWRYASKRVREGNG